jgi:putative transposase
VYDYRTLTSQQRQEIVNERRRKGYPWHGPPHFPEGDNLYMLTAACYEHRQILTSTERLSELAQVLLEGIEGKIGGEVHAWVVLPNHYHLLARVDLEAFSSWIGRLHNGKATQWNREDGAAGCQVWHRFSDRLIRGDRHYFASVNYIHANPIKHGYVPRGADWAWSSLHEFIDAVGSDTLAEWWWRYPIGEYGKKWDP